jgi:glutaredoxin
MFRPPPLPVRVCSKHGLVSGLDGRCVICRRDDVEGNEERSSIRILGWALIFALLFGGVFVWRTFRQIRAPAAPAVVKDEAPVRPPPPVEEPPALEPPPFDPARAARQAAAEQQRQRDIEADMKRVVVRMFVIKACEMCDVARAFLADKGLRVNELDVQADPSALEAMGRITPSKELPVFDVEGEVLVGFGPTSVLSAVRRAAERHHEKR